jgi:hypothetical protein
VRDAISEKERFAGEARKVQAILRSALEVVETSWQDEPRAAEQERVAKPSVIQDTPGDTTQAFRKLTG